MFSGTQWSYHSKPVFFSANESERWALGSAYRMVHRHANKAVSFLTTFDMYNDGLQMTREFAQIQRRQGHKVEIPPEVKMNKDNVPVLQKTLYEVQFLVSLYCVKDIIQQICFHFCEVIKT